MPKFKIVQNFTAFHSNNTYPNKDYKKHDIISGTSNNEHILTNDGYEIPLLMVNNGDAESIALPNPTKMHKWLYFGIGLVVGVGGSIGIKLLVLL